jgi:hypothetical protein
MRTNRLSVPQLAFIVGTRVAAGAGIALLLSDKLSPTARRSTGLWLIAIGALTTLLGNRNDVSSAAA